MGYLNDSVPADSEAVKLGASRIRALQTQLNAVIEQIFSDAGTFLTKWITTAMIQDDAITATQIVNSAISTNKIASRAVTNDKLAAGTAGGVFIYDNSGNPTAIAPGAAGTVLTSNGTAVAFAGSSAKGVPSFISPVNVGTITAAHKVSFDDAGWNTVNTLASFGVPPTASAVILYIEAATSGSTTGHVGIRSASGGAQIKALFSGGNSGIGVAASQGIFPFFNSSGVLSFDYSAYADNANSGVTNIYLVGWIS